MKIVRVLGLAAPILSSETPPPKCSDPHEPNARHNELLILPHLLLSSIFAHLEERVFPSHLTFVTEEEIE